MEDYQEIIQKLQNNELKEILIKHDEFADFHKAWLAYDQRDEIVGEAQIGGNVIFRHKSKN